MPKQKPPETWESDIRRGLLQLLVLATIKEAESTFGYEIAQTIRKRTADRLIVKDGTLYPLLRRLETHKLVNSSWDTTGERPRKYYQLTNKGEQQLQAMIEVWNDLIVTLDPLFRAIGADRASNGTFQEEARFCSECGNQVYPGAIFCAACGAQLAKSDET
jgi:DNA-binding PadR family transcriptional regulator